MENQKTNTALYIIIIILSVVIAILGSYIFFGKEQNKELSANNTTNENITNDNVNENTTNNENTKTETKEITERTYRFFGYDINNGPDMYTTLKLYSNGKFNFYVNNCEGVNKISGTYTETDTNITLNDGTKNIIFPKLDNGNQLDFKATNLGTCSGISGSFSLENSILDNNTNRTVLED